MIVCVIDSNDNNNNNNNNNNDNMNMNMNLGRQLTFRRVMDIIILSKGEVACAISRKIVSNLPIKSDYYV